MARRKTGIIYITLVHISDAAMNTWLHILRTLIQKCIKWIVDVSCITILAGLYITFSIIYRTGSHFLNCLKVDMVAALIWILLQAIFIYVRDFVKQSLHEVDHFPLQFALPL